MAMQNLAEYKQKPAAALTVLGNLNLENVDLHTILILLKRLLISMKKHFVQIKIIKLQKLDWLRQIMPTQAFLTNLALKKKIKNMLK